MNSTLGTLGKRVLAWIVIAVVVVLALKLAVGLVVGFATTVFMLILAAAAIVGLVWAFRHASLSVGGAAYLVICFSFALAGGIVGKVKGSSFFIWFLVSGIAPFIGLLAALAYRNDRDEKRRQCPRCGKVVKLHDALCTRCGEELEFPSVAIAPESAARR